MTATDETPQQTVLFGDYTFDLEHGELRRSGVTVDLRPQATRALALLIERRGALVGREEFRQELWGERYVDWESGLHQCIRQIRTVLDGDSSTSHIDTVPRRGYRFAVPVHWQPAPPSASPTSSPIAPRPVRFMQARAFVAGAATIAALPVAIVLLCALLAGSQN